MTRKACVEKIDPAGPDEPENSRACRFWISEYESCAFRNLIDELGDLGSLVGLMGMNEYIKLHDDWPHDSKGKRCRDWTNW